MGICFDHLELSFNYERIFQGIQTNLILLWNLDPDSICLWTEGVSELIGICLQE